MVKYICEKCNKIFAAKIDYTRHMNRKKPCNTNRDLQMNLSVHNDTVLISKDADKKHELICHYCSKVFSCVSALCHHVRLNCEMKKQEDMCQQLKVANDDSCTNHHLQPYTDANVPARLHLCSENEKKTIDLNNDLDNCIDYDDDVDNSKIIQNNVDEINSESNNKLVTFSENNEIIFSNEQKEYIISKFPITIQELLRKVKNPLDEKEVIVNMFIEKNVRIVIKYEKDFMDDYDWMPYFHCHDVAIVINYGKTNVNRWNERWKFNLIPYEKLLLQIGGATQFMNFDENRTDKNALFIGLDDLKDVLLKINTDLSKEYKKWVMKQSSIMSKFLRYTIQVKNEYEMEQKNCEIEKYKQQVKQIEEAKQKEIYEIKKRIEKSVEVYPINPKQKGYVYIIQSEFLKTKGLVRIGRTLNIEKREGQYRCSDPTYNVEYYRDVEDRILIEKALHYILNNIRKYSNREFFYCLSIDEIKEIVDMNINLIEETIKKQDKITKEIRNEYIKGKITELIEENEEKIKRERSRSKSPSANIR